MSGWFDGLVARVLDDLAAHPGSSARQVGTRIGEPGRTAYTVLEFAERGGRVQRRRDDIGAPWLWSLPGAAPDAGEGGTP